jgi:hypothetical protein
MLLLLFNLERGREVEGGREGEGGGREEGDRVSVRLGAHVVAGKQEGNSKAEGLEIFVGFRKKV